MNQSLLCDIIVFTVS